MQPFWPTICIGVLEGGGRAESNNPIQGGPFRGLLMDGGRGDAKRLLPLKNMSHISYNEEVWDSYALPKEDPKIYKSGDTFLDLNWRQYLFTRN